MPSDGAMNIAKLASGTGGGDFHARKRYAPPLTVNRMKRVERKRKTTRKPLFRITGTKNPLLRNALNNIASESAQHVYGKALEL